MTYGNFAEPKIETGSKRSEDVLLTALERCEQLEQRLEEACIIIGEKELDIIKLKEEVDFLKKRVELLKKT